MLPSSLEFNEEWEGGEREREERGKERNRIWGCERDFYRDEPEDSLQRPAFISGRSPLQHRIGIPRTLESSDSLTFQAWQGISHLVIQFTLTYMTKTMEKAGTISERSSHSTTCLRHGESCLCSRENTVRGPDSSCEVSPKDTF